MFNLAAISKLLQDNPNLLTTEGLSALFHDCICLKYAQNHRFTYPSLLVDKSIYLELAQLSSSNTEDAQIIHRISTSSKIWAKDGADTVQEGADFLYLLRKIRDNIHNIQQDLGISGVSQRNIAIRDRLFSYPTAEEQLILLESDRTVLQQAVPKIIKFFLQLAQMSPAYNLFLVQGDEQQIPASATAIEDMAQKAVRADIHCNSYDWELTSANRWSGRHTHKVDPDEIQRPSVEGTLNGQQATVKIFVEMRKLLKSKVSSTNQGQKLHPFPCSLFPVPCCL